MSVKHSDEFKRDAVRIALISGLTRRQVASDLSIGLSTLGKWIVCISDEAKVPAQDVDILRENECLGASSGGTLGVQSRHLVDRI